MRSKLFKKGKQSVVYEPRNGFTFASTKYKHVDPIRELVFSDCGLKLKDIIELWFGSCQVIFNDYLGLQHDAIWICSKTFNLFQMCSNVFHWHKHENNQDKSSIFSWYGAVWLFFSFLGWAAISVHHFKFIGAIKQNSPRTLKGFNEKEWDANFDYGAHSFVSFFLNKSR